MKVSTLGFVPQRLLIVGLIVLLLAAAAPVGGWHQEDEIENRHFGATAGDSRVLEDANGCLNETKPVNEVTCVVLYGHIFDLINRFPMNTQRPAECASDLARGSTTTPGVEPFFRSARHSGFASPGFVPYLEPDEGTTCDEQPRYQHHVGPVYDVALSKDFDITGTWYLSSDLLEQSALGVGTGPDSTTPSFGAMPCLTLRVSLETGRFVEEGEVIASGETTKTVLSTPYGMGLGDDTPVGDPCPDSDGLVRAQDVTGFHVNLGRASRTIAHHEGLVVGVQWYQHNGTSGDPAEEDNWVQSDWNLHTGSDYPNRIVLPLENAIEVQDLRFFERPGDDAPPTNIRFVVQTPWGDNDVDQENYKLGLYDDQGEEVALEQLREPWVYGYEDIDTSHTPWNVTVPWDWEAEDLAPGEYTIRVTATNWQHTATVQKEIPLTVGGEEEPRGLPGPTVPLLFLCVLLLLRAQVHGRRPAGPTGSMT